MNVVSMEKDRHVQVQALLPWYVNAQLDDEDMRLVQDHVRDCPRCRAELEAEQALQDQKVGWDGAAHPGGTSAVERRGVAAAANARAVDDGVDQGLHRMDARIRALNPAAAPGWPSRIWLRSRQWHLWGWMALLQCAAIVLLLTLLMRGNQGQGDANGSAAYRALSAQPVATQGQGLIMFKPEATERQLREALQGCGASLVNGPTASHAYVLRFESVSGEAMACLRAKPMVSMAEPLDPAALQAPVRP